MAESTIDIDAVVAKFGAYILGMTEDEVRNDSRRWAGIHWDDGFFDEMWEAIDWEELSIPDEVKNYNREEGYWFWGRNDFDYGKSIIDWEGFLPDETTDLSLQSFFVDGSIYGQNLAELIKQERVSAEDVDFAMVLGRLEASSESLMDALKAILMIENFAEQPMELHEYAETDPDHEEFVNSFEEGPLRDHISMYFQEPNACRCGGAAPDFLDPEKENVWEMFGKVAFQKHYSWWMGEGQGSCDLVEIIDDTIPEVPPYDGKGLKYKTRREIPATGQPSESGSAQEILATPMVEYLKQSELGSVSRVAEKLEGRNLDAVLLGISLTPGALFHFVDVDTLMRWREFRIALSVLDARIKYQTGAVLSGDLIRKSNVLLALKCADEAVEAAQEMLTHFDNDEPSEYSRSAILNQIAWCAYHAGKHQLGIDTGREAVKEDPENEAAKATLAVCLIANGDEKEGFKLLEEAMDKGIDPEPLPELEQDERYLELAKEYDIPVFKL